MAIEVLFLLAAAALFLTGCRIAIRAPSSRWKRSAPWWIGCLALVFVRQWTIGPGIFRDPSGALRQQVEKVPEVVQNLQTMNDWIFHYGILLGIPAAFLLGYLFHKATGFAFRLIFRIPIFLAGCASLFLLHQILTKRADGFGEALQHLWAALGGLAKH